MPDGIETKACRRSLDTARDVKLGQARLDAGRKRCRAELDKDRRPASAGVSDIQTTDP